MTAADEQVEAFNRRMKRWANETHALREVLRGCGLDESLKWGKPCFTFEGANVAIIQPFKASCALMFFKGTLLKDPKKVLREVGPNSQAAKRLEFTSLEALAEAEKTVRAYVKEAVQLEKAGARVPFKQRHALALPAELEARLKKDKALAAAFKALTPGRQRGWVMHFSSAKQAATRASRIEKAAPAILSGKGFGER